MQEKTRLTTAISIAALLTAAIAAGISNQALPPAAFWVAAAAFGGVLAAFVWPLLRDTFSRNQTYRHRRRIARQFRARLVALASVVTEITSSSSDSRSVGSILNTAYTYKAMGAYAVNASLAHLCTLGGWSKSIHQRAINGDLAGVELSLELAEVTREYIRLCNLIGAEIEAHFSEPAAAGRAISQAWAQILRQVNAITDEIVAVGRAINLEHPQANLPMYMIPANDLSFSARFAEPGSRQ
jgi:hypothetical protein